MPTHRATISYVPYIPSGQEIEPVQGIALRRHGLVLHQDLPNNLPKQQRNKRHLGWEIADPISRCFIVKECKSPKDAINKLRERIRYLRRLEDMPFRQLLAVMRHCAAQVQRRLEENQKVIDGDEFTEMMRREREKLRCYAMEEDDGYCD